MSETLPRRTTGTTTAADDPRTPIAVTLDTIAIVVFVAVGRRTHEQDPGFAGVMFTAAPFLIALAVGWFALRAWNRPFGLLTGIGLWAIVMVGGMLLRNHVFDRGTAASFVIVAAAFTAATLIGWRLIARLVDAIRLGRRAAS